LSQLRDIARRVEPVSKVEAMKPASSYENYCEKMRRPLELFGLFDAALQRDDWTSRRWSSVT
jgi:hypothetical protein